MSEHQEDYGINTEQIPAILERLQFSKFRKSFFLNKQDYEYILNKGFDTVMEHAGDFVRERIAPLSLPIRDGKQTPYKGHPVFKAQHATATCCRNCLMKHHNLPKNVALNEDQVFYIVVVIGTWLRKKMKKFGKR